MSRVRTFSLHNDLVLVSIVVWCHCVPLTHCKQNMSAFDQWSSISQSPSHFHSGSMSSGINSSHLDLMDDNNFNFVHQHQLARQHHQLAAQRANQLGQRALSTSVFNLNHINRKQPPTTNGWMNNSMQQVCYSSIFSESAMNLI